MKREIRSKDKELMKNERMYRRVIQLRKDNGLSAFRIKILFLFFLCVMAFFAIFFAVLIEAANHGMN
jgi:hypothetical protein